MVAEASKTPKGRPPRRDPERSRHRAEIWIWLGFGVAVLIAIGISFYGLRPIPQRPAPKEGSFRAQVSQIAPSQLTWNYQTTWKGAPGTLQVKLFLTPNLADFRYTFEGQEPVEMRFVTMEAETDRGYRELFQEPEAPWGIVYPGETYSRQYTLGGAVFVGARLTFEIRAGDRLYRDVLTFLPPNLESQSASPPSP